MAAFVIKVYEGEEGILPGASVGIFDINGAPLMSTIADVDGFALLVTDEDQVRVRASLYGYTFPNNVVLTPEDGHVYNLYATADVVAPPLDSHLCRVYGQVRDPLGGELPDRWKLKVIRVGVVGDAHTYDVVTGSANINHHRGDVLVDLVQGAPYRIGPLPITRYGDTDYEDMSYVDINVPRRSTARLVDLIAPRAFSIEAAESLTAQVNATQEIELTVTLSDDTVTDRPSVYLTAVTDSSDVHAEIKGGKLSVTCFAAGTYTVRLNTYIDASQLNGAFYRPCVEKTLHQIEVECEP